MPQQFHFMLQPTHRRIHKIGAVMINIWKVRSMTVNSKLTVICGSFDVGAGGFDSLGC
jgi:hypothetical protein